MTRDEAGRALRQTAPDWQGRAVAALVCLSVFVLPAGFVVFGGQAGVNAPAPAPICGVECSQTDLFLAGAVAGAMR